ncbi:MAG: hypothetical protein SGPRY_002119 [Prymnesium sp.]
MWRGSMLFAEGRYWLYGNHQRPCASTSRCNCIGDPPDQWTVTSGIAIYSSVDLQVWRKEAGPILAPFNQPRAVFSPLTQRYHVYLQFPLRVATSTAPAGPFALESSVVSLDHPSSDINAFVDPVDNRTHIIFTDAERFAMRVQRLTADGRRGEKHAISEPIGDLTQVEAPTMFKRGSLYYALFGHNWWICLSLTLTLTLILNLHTCPHPHPHSHPHLHPRSPLAPHPSWAWCRSWCCREGAEVFSFTATSPLGPWGGGEDVNLVAQLVRSRSIPPLAKPPLALPRSCWTWFPSGCAAHPTNKPVGKWVRDSWGEEHKGATHPERCIARAASFNSFCHVSDVITTHVGESQRAISGQSAFVLPVKCGDSTTYLLALDEWQTSETRAAQYQHWEPLEFNTDGTIAPLHGLRHWEIKGASHHMPPSNPPLRNSEINGGSPQMPPSNPPLRNWEIKGGSHHMPPSNPAVRHWEVKGGSPPPPIPPVVLVAAVNESADLPTPSDDVVLLPVSISSLPQENTATWITPGGAATLLFLTMVVLMVGRACCRERFSLYINALTQFSSLKDALTGALYPCPLQPSDDKRVYEEAPLSPTAETLELAAQETEHK